MLFVDYFWVGSPVLSEVPGNAAVDLLLPARSGPDTVRR
jgi:hypothetical protein